VIDLPIDPLLPEVLRALDDGRTAVVEASPGAGKTTRVPRALLSRPGGIVVLEPRRLAARMAAQRVADELGEPLGATVGYQVRFDHRVSRRTRLRFVTEGVLTRQLASDPTLSDVSMVVFDELHERHLSSDLSLALLERLRRDTRPDLALVAMSATLDHAPVVELLDAAYIHCSVQRFEVAIEHHRAPVREPLDVQVASTVRRLVRDGLSGHVLVFLPGAADIRRTAERCRAVAEQHALRVLPLHGGLSATEQDQAVAPSEQRKLILSTNVAETSLTIDDVAAVIDSGLVKVAVQRPWSTLAALETRHVSQASARQRAGRAGRTRAGRCLRLYTERELERQPAFDEPEIGRSDLCETVLALRMAGASADELKWLTPPPADALASAQRLLRALGAIDDDTITPLGRQLAQLPLHPRLGCTLVAAQARGATEEAATALAVLAEQDLRVGRRSVNLWDRVELFEQARAARFDAQRCHSLGVDHRRARVCDRLRQQLLRIADRLEPGLGSADHDAITSALACGFPDRVAKRSGTAGRSITLALADGGKATLTDEAAFDHGDFTLALEGSLGKPGEPAKVRLAAPISGDQLLDAFMDQIAERRDLRWSDGRKRVEAFSQLRYRGLVVEEVTKPAQPSAQATALLLEAARRKGGLQQLGGEMLARWLERLRFAAQTDASLPTFDEAHLAALCEGMTSFEQLQGLGHLVAAELSPQRTMLERRAPDRVRLGGGQELVVHYPTNAPPWVASYLQDFFGMAAGPQVSNESLVLHLWAPNGRAVQVTADLASFWRTHYPKLRRQLSRRYPKHHWPEEPQRAPAVRLARKLPS